MWTNCHRHEFWWGPTGGTSNVVQWIEWTGTTTGWRGTSVGEWRHLHLQPMQHTAQIAEEGLQQKEIELLGAESQHGDTVSRNQKDTQVSGLSPSLLRWDLSTSYLEAHNTLIWENCSMAAVANSKYIKCPILTIAATKTKGWKRPLSITSSLNDRRNC